MEKKEMLEGVTTLLSKLVMGKDYVGKIPGVGGTLMKGVEFVAAPLSAILRELQPTFNVPQALENNPLLDTQRVGTEIKILAEQQIQILDSFIVTIKNNALTNSFSDLRNKLINVMENPENNAKFHEAQAAIFSTLKRERNSCKDGLDFLYFDLAIRRMGFDMNLETGSKLSQEIKFAMEHQIFPIIEGFLQKLKAQMLHMETVES